MASKYDRLKKFLSSLDCDVVELSFDEVSSIINGLPRVAFEQRKWWDNDERNIQARNGWLAAGFRVVGVNLKNRLVVFSKVS
ncbi:MAG: hypothetical protein NDF54_04160 [archaeon GB-1867-035]|nr:hypothetical protein [Candidatus Culexmicrobium profundum]